MNNYNYVDHMLVKTPRSPMFSRPISSMSYHTSDGNHSTNNVNEQLGKETKKILSDGFYISPTSLKVNLQKNIEKCVANTKYYPHSTPFPRPKSMNIGNSPQIYFIDENGIDFCYEKVSSINLGNVKVCLLNFGSSIEPCRGFDKGENGQECDNARKTTLYSSLCYSKNSRSMKCDFYNKSDDNENGFIYSPEVCIIRNPDNDLISSKDKIIDIITASSVHFGNTPKLKKKMEEKISTIIDIARYHEVQILVLGAFGCGRNRNDPKEIAEIFKKVLIDEENAKFFEEIYFAIIDKKVKKIFEEEIK